MSLMKSQCRPLSVFPISLRRCLHPPLDIRRHRWVRRAVPPTVYVPDAYTAVTAASPPDTQSLAVFVAGGIGMALLIGLGFSSQIQGKGSVVMIPPSKLAALLKNKQTLLLDVRNRKALKEFGSPNFKGIAANQKTMSFYKSTRDGDIADPKFGEKFAKMKGLSTDSIVILMDDDGKSGTQAARAIFNFAELKEICVLSGGAAGLKASGWEWNESIKEAPISLPKVKMSVPKVKMSVPKVKMSLPKVSVKGLDLDKVAETYKDRPTLFNTGIAIGALATAGIVLFNEFDIILEMVGLLGGTNVFFKRFFFAKDREKTIKDLRTLVDDKIAAAEAADDLKQLATTILETPSPDIDEEPKTTPMPTVKDVTDQLVDTV